MDKNPLLSFFMSGRRVSYGKGEIVLPGNDENPDVCYIADGFIKAYSIDDEGDIYIHLIYKQGEIFPLEWAVKDHRRLIFYETLSPCTILKISKDRFAQHIKDSCKPFGLSLVEQLADQLNIYGDRLDNLEYKSAYERVVYRLLFLASRFGKELGSKHVVIEAPLTHRTIAESINLARESFSREFEKLTEKGLVAANDGHIVITDIKKLCHEFSEPPSLDYWGIFSDSR